MFLLGTATVLLALRFSFLAAISGLGRLLLIQPNLEYEASPFSPLRQFATILCTMLEKSGNALAKWVK